MLSWAVTIVMIGVGLFAYDTFGLVIGTILWAACIAAVVTLGAIVKRFIGDPLAAYDRERR